MPAIFTPRHGYVAILEEDAFPGVVCPNYPTTLEGWSGAEILRCIITRVGGTMPEGFQFLHSLDDLIYLYVFGSRIAEMTVGGLAFALDCAEGAQSNSHGIESALDFFAQHKVSVQAAPIRLTVGQATCFDGFLTGFHYDVLDPKIDLYQFSMRLHYAPNATECGG